MTDDAMNAASTDGEFERAERTRCRRRSRLMLAAAPIALIAGLAGAKLVHQHLVAELALAQYLDGEAEAALNTAGQLHWLNLVERWKPDYNTGTSLLALDALDDAVAAFERALPLASPPEQCPIRANLAIALERQGDRSLAGNDPAGAGAKYEAALAVIAEQDPSCPGSTSGRSLADSEIRIREKLEQLEQQAEDPNADPQDQDGDGRPDDPQDDPSQPDPDLLDKLEEGLEGNTQEREEDVEDRQNWEDGGGGNVDQPW